MAIHKEFGKEIVNALKYMPQSVLAEKLGVSQSLVSQMVRGKLPENIELIRKFAEAVGESPDEWEIKVRMAKNELFLRQNNKLSEETIKILLKTIEEEERKHQENTSR
jgi:transcriptional regulator with XRE-family HTH domain